MAGLGYGLAFGAQGASDALRQLIADRLKQQMDQREMTLREQEAAQNAQINQAKLASLGDEHKAQADLRSQEATNLAAARHLPGDTLPADSTDTTVLQAAGLVNSNPPAAGGQFMGADAQDFAPGAQPGKTYLGTAAQRQTIAGQDEQRRLRGEFINSPDATPQMRGYLRLLPLDKTPDASVFKPDEALVQVDDGSGNPTFVPRSQANGRQPYVKPTKEPTPHFTVQQTYDATGKPNGLVKVNTLDGSVTPVANAPNIKPTPGAAQAAQMEQRKGEAQDALNQLDQAIEQAKDLIGPGPGRISSIEQMVGNADPKIQALGTKMLMAKMKIDAGIGGMRAAASPQLLSRWDNLLGNNITPEGLHASVQAMREITGGSHGGGERVRVKGPNGETGTVPKGAALPAGWSLQ